jgi:L-lactate dehydrogenase complex protein LldE
MPSRPSRVRLFVTCLVDAFFPDTGESVVRVLERLGVSVVFDVNHTCCGQPEFNAGFAADASALARRTVDLLSADDLPVVVPSGSCTDMIVHRYPDLLADDARDAQRARDLSRRVFEFSQFIVNELGTADTGARCAGCLTYHPACHGLRGLNLREEPARLLDAVKDATIVPLDDADTCCGFGGLFSVKMPAVSSAMLDRKIACIERSGADTVVTTDVSCGMHIAGGLRRRKSAVRVAHLADVLGKSQQI